MASLATQVGYATFLFLAIGLFAIIVHAAIHFCGLHNLAPAWMLGVAEVLAGGIWLIDIACFGLFMFTELIDFRESMVGRAR